MLLKRPSLILKEYNIQTLNTDIVNHLYTSFNPYDVKNSVSLAIEDWLEKLGHSKFRSAEIITADNTLEANKERTKAIINYLEPIINDGTTHIIRQAASTSSAAISETECHSGDTDGEYQRLLLKEKNLISQLAVNGSILRLIISPKTQLEIAELGLITHEYTYRNIITRYQTLIHFIENNINNQQLQVVYTLRLPHDNLTIIDQQTTFIGRKRRRESGFPYTTQIFDPAVIAAEVEDFDSIFTDTVGVLLGIDRPDESNFGSLEIKNKVIQELNRCKAKLQGFLLNLVHKEPNPPEKAQQIIRRVGLKFNCCLIRL